MSNRYVSKSIKRIESLIARQKIQRVVVGAVLICMDKILLVQRRTADTYGGYFELPGGLVENHESLVHAAIREVYEETELRITDNDLHFVKHGFDYLSDLVMTRQINMVFELSDVWPQVKLSEHSDYLWVEDKALLSDDIKMTDQMRESIRNILLDYKDL